MTQGPSHVVEIEKTEVLPKHPVSERYRVASFFEDGVFEVDERVRSWHPLDNQVERVPSGALGVTQIKEADGSNAQGLARQSLRRDRRDRGSRHEPVGGEHVRRDDVARRVRLEDRLEVRSEAVGGFHAREPVHPPSGEDRQNGSVEGGVRDEGVEHRPQVRKAELVLARTEVYEVHQDPLLRREVDRERLASAVATHG